MAFFFPGLPGRDGGTASGSPAGGIDPRYPGGPDMLVFFVILGSWLLGLLVGLVLGRWP